MLKKIVLKTLDIISYAILAFGTVVFLAWGAYALVI